MQNDYKLEPLEINPKQAVATRSIIWLHGLGADGYDFVDIVSQLNLPDELGIRFIFPHAPVRPITWNNGMPMRAWFDIETLNAAKFVEDEKGILDSAQIINDLIAKEIKSGISNEQIILAGFSQGAAMALHTGLRYPEKLGGILVLSGFLLFANKLKAEKNPINQNIPILMIHGIFDDIVKITWAEQGYQKLLAEQYQVQFKKYQMHHEVCTAEINDIANWIKRLF